MRACGWCSSPVTAARRDARFCSKRCRQASHRARVGHSELATTDRPLRLAYADPPYIGLSRRYYGDQDTFAGEVDHRELLSRLSTYDGWALSASSRSVPAIAAMCVAQDLAPRIAVWVRRPAPHAAARIVTAWEAVFYSPARTARDPDATGPLSDVFDEIRGARPRPTLPGSVIGMKPPAYAVWIFQLLGATPGDDLDDLFPGSGIVDRTWRDWSRDPSFAPAHSTIWQPSPAAAAELSRGSVSPVDALDG